MPMILCGEGGGFRRSKSLVLLGNLCKMNRRCHCVIINALVASISQENSRKFIAGMNFVIIVHNSIAVDTSCRLIDSIAADISYRLID